MKNSGIEWIGEIPKTWSIGKTLFALSMPITDGPHETPQLHDSGIPFVSAEAVSTGYGRINFKHVRGYISKDYYDVCCKKYIPQNNDILPQNNEIPKNNAILRDLKRLKASKPKTSIRDCFFSRLTIGQTGRE